MKRFRQKQYTQWDETDTLKGMTDANILAEKKRKDPSRIAGAVRSGAIGGTIGAVGGALLGARKGGLAGAIKGAKFGGTLGAGAGMVHGGLIKGQAQRNENAFYNDRLQYAQRQALRRERKDWKTNMTQRDGYTY